ncbi:apocarotenoid-15,15'-oxygenase-like [Rhopilema esculentum]|uniref:apocarotenoid-15,15'-oxygenase-like n=1 Tax=Rhopilema esculentum TaxID=499914 RepID=UPI0031D5590A
MRKCAGRYWSETCETAPLMARPRENDPASEFQNGALSFLHAESLDFRYQTSKFLFLQLLSLYETSLRYCLDPRNLETLGLDNLNGNLSLGCLGAHFKIDAVNKRLVCFSQRPGFRRSPGLDVFEFNEDWSLHQKQRRLIEGLNYMHDFALLPEYYIVHITPFVKVTTWLSLKIAAGWTSPGEAMEHHKDLPSKFVIIPRDPAKSDQIVTVDTGTFHIFHFGTAEQEGHLLKFTAPCLGPKFNMDFDSEVWLSNTSVAPGKVTNFVIDLNSKTSSLISCLHVLDM